jgi:hypothetical protein
MWPIASLPSMINPTTFQWRTHGVGKHIEDVIHFGQTELMATM